MPSTGVHIVDSVCTQGSKGIGVAISPGRGVKGIWVSPSITAVVAIPSGICVGGTPPGSAISPADAGVDISVS